MTSQIITKAEREALKRNVGLGDAVKTVIHAGLDVLPISEATRTRIKKCSKCAKRRAKLNEMAPNLWRPFTG